MTTTPQAPIDVQVRALLESLGPVQARAARELTESLVVLERVVNASQAAQAQVMVEMSRRAHADDLADTAHPDSAPLLVPGGTREEFVVDEIAMHLHCTRVAASYRFGTDLAAAEHPAVQAAWSAGSIDARKVQIIGDG
ncbi:MAG: hypothetical protein ABI720_12185, partial [Actinomycetes bacterium]